MYPYANVLNVKVYIFPLVIMFAIFICILVVLLGKKTRFIDYIFNYDLEMLFFLLVFSVLGGKIFSAISFSFANKPIEIWKLGFVFYGGYFGFELGLYIYCKVKHKNYKFLNNLFSVVLPLGQSIGRIGCFLNGCCYGVEMKNCITISYPINGKYIDVFPVWFFESMFCFCMFLLLYNIKTENKGGIYICCYATFRFVIEFFRGDAMRGFISVFSISQWISLIIIGFYFLKYLFQIVRIKYEY